MGVTKSSSSLSSRMMAKAEQEAAIFGFRAYKV